MSWPPNHPPRSPDCSQPLQPLWKGVLGEGKWEFRIDTAAGNMIFLNSDPRFVDYGFLFREPFVGGAFVSFRMQNGVAFCAYNFNLILPDWSVYFLYVNGTAMIFSSRSGLGKKDNDRSKYVNFVYNTVLHMQHAYIRFIEKIFKC